MIFYKRFIIFKAPVYLMVAGGIITTMNILVLLAYLTPCDEDDKIVAGLWPIVSLGMFAFSIWGSFVVFGKRKWIGQCILVSTNVHCLIHFRSVFKWISNSIRKWKFWFIEIVLLGSYSTWNYEDNKDANYCEYTPFMFAFVLLIMQWILIPVMVLLACGLGCTIMVRKTRDVRFSKGCPI